MTVCSQKIGAFLVPDYPLGTKFLKSGAAILLGSHGGCTFSSSPAGSVCFYMTSRMCIPSVEKQKWHGVYADLALLLYISFCIAYR
ncbi:hypothetical protein SORBI_3004G162100 [Sorghum bicolor]|uniref:Uncharacterized protein n=1 Tax=Sorghum bicolor TaxID=4558 RepID=A0A194YQ07_SORBI|nr:hypothetical protein SORBI_3004G162100 [Sorghum bicolor]